MWKLATHNELAMFIVIFWSRRLGLEQTLWSGQHCIVAWHYIHDSLEQSVICWSTSANIIQICFHRQSLFCQWEPEDGAEILIMASQRADLMRYGWCIDISMFHCYTRDVWTCHKCRLNLDPIYHINVTYN